MLSGGLDAMNEARFAVSLASIAHLTAHQRSDRIALSPCRAPPPPVLLPPPPPCLSSPPPLHHPPPPPPPPSPLPPPPPPPNEWVMRPARSSVACLGNPARDTSGALRQPPAGLTMQSTIPGRDPPPAGLHPPARRGQIAPGCTRVPITGGRDGQSRLKPRRRLEPRRLEPRRLEPGRRRGPPHRSHPGPPGRPA